MTIFGAPGGRALPDTHTMNATRLFALVLALAWAGCRTTSPTPTLTTAPTTIRLWPGTAPGSPAASAPEQDVTKPTDNIVAGKRVARLGNVSQPSITIYRPSPKLDTGTAVVVCPGGGYHILAIDLEGTEVCQWLNSIGVTGVLLKYRVPKQDGLEKHALALQDAQRAVGLVRSRAAEFGLDPNRIGVLGFSAGGHLAAAVSNNYQQRSYPAVDAADAVSCRPDFTVLIYPAYLTLEKESQRVSPELPITTNTPPTFISISQDDPVRVENALFYALALKGNKVPVELHVYPQGGHGYGLRRTARPVTWWPDRVADWLRTGGWLARR